MKRPLSPPFKTNLIGTPQQIAERIVALKEVGVGLILLGFLHFQEEVEYFGKHVIPLVAGTSASARRRACSGPWNPALAAKQIATINHLTEGHDPIAVGAPEVGDP